MKENILQKLGSSVTWVSIIALVAELIFIFSPSVSDEFSQISTIVVSILVAFGVLNNPNNREGF